MAHSYSTDSDERRNVPFLLALLAVGASFFIYWILSKIEVELPWWGPPVDTMAFYGLFYAAFDRWIWKTKLMTKLSITRMPNLSGTWRGRVTPGVGAAPLGVPVDVEVTMTQTWATLLICGRSEFSKSRSLSGSITVEDEVSVTYQYISEPLPNAATTMHTHRGTALLVLTSAGKLEGEYYSGRDRQSFGAITLTQEA